jgi:tetratricopeptide (TPR) repeat protein
VNRDFDISQKELEAIEQFIFQQMNAEETAAFTKKLSADLALQHKLETVKLLLVGIQEVELEKKLDEFHNGLHLLKKNSIQPSTKTFSLKKWLVAASVVIIVGLGSLLFWNQDTKEEKLFAAYFQPEPGLISEMGTSDNYLFDRAMVDYKVGDYDAALITWESLLATKPENDTLNYFIGSAYLIEEKEEIAIVHFKKVIANENSFFRNDALWYTGLALLKSNKKMEALDFIEKAEHENKAALLKDLKNSE